MIKTIRKLWSWLGANIIFPVVFLLFGAGVLRWVSTKRKTSPGSSKEETKLRDEATKVEVEAAKAKATAETKAEMEVESLKRVGSDPEGARRRDRLAEELNK